MPWQPVVDGDVIPGPPIDRIAGGAGGDVELIVGTNVDDWRLFLVASGAIDQVTEETLTGPVEEGGYQALAAYGLPVQTALAAYRAACPGAGPGDLLAAVQTDWWVRVPGIRLADAHATARSDTYMYMSSLGSRRRSADGSAPSMPWRSLSSSTPWTRTFPCSGRCWPRTRRSSSRTPCTQRGCRSPPPGTPAGRGTTWAAGRPCGSTSPRRWWTTRGPGNARCGRAFASSQVAGVRRAVLSAATPRNTCGPRPEKGHGPQGHGAAPQKCPPARRRAMRRTATPVPRCVRFAPTGASYQRPRGRGGRPEPPPPRGRQLLTAPRCGAGGRPTCPSRASANVNDVVPVLRHQRHGRTR